MATMELRREILTNPELAYLAWDLSILAANAEKKPSAISVLDTLDTSSERRSNGVDA